MSVHFASLMYSKIWQTRTATVPAVNYTCKNKYAPYKNIKAVYSCRHTSNNYMATKMKIQFLNVYQQIHQLCFFETNTVKWTTWQLYECCQIYVGVSVNKTIKWWCIQKSPAMWCVHNCITCKHVSERDCFYLSEISRHPLFIHRKSTRTFTNCSTWTEPIKKKLQEHSLIVPHEL